MGQNERHLEPQAVEALLKQLSPAADELVLIGGQALNLWTERYDSAPELQQKLPFTSKDIDFYGEIEHVERCARLLNVSPHLYRPEDRTICSGTITTADGISLDFLHTPRGVRPPTEILRRSISFPQIRVMHPIHVLMSRTANVVQIPRSDQHSLDQLRAAVVVAREFIREVARNEVKSAQKLNEEVFALALRHDGLSLWREHNVDVFDAVVFDSSLGDSFTSIRYPQMRDRIAARRAT